LPPNNIFGDRLKETKELSPACENKKETNKVSDVSRNKETGIFSTRIIVPRSVCPDSRSPTKEQRAKLD
jgi:hypothetical protein